MDRYGFLKTAAAIPSVRVADCAYNGERIAALVAEALKAEKPAPRPVVAAYAMSAGIAAKGEYDDLLGRD